MHAADVLQSVYYYMFGAGAVQDLCKATTFDLLSLFLSSASHDLDHPGNNNVFESKTRSKLATLYNDFAILENHHAASFFFLVEDEELNIFKEFSREEMTRTRK